MFRLKKNTCTFIPTPVATLLPRLSLLSLPLSFVVAVSFSPAIRSGLLEHFKESPAIAFGLGVSVLHQKIASVIVLPFLEKHRSFIHRERGFLLI